MQKIGLMYRPIADILADFNAPVDPRIIGKKPIFKRISGKLEKVGEVDFLHWYDLVSELHRISPGWSWECRTQFLPDRCVIEGRLTVRASEGEFFMEATGVEPLDSNCYGDPVYSAEASALRRAMAKFGYALDLWRKPDDSSDEVKSKSTPLRVIKRSTDLNEKVVTQKQLTLLCTIANERGLAIDTDVKAIVKKFGYESKKNILQKDLDPIIADIKAAGKFLTMAQRQELINWWRIEKINDQSAIAILNTLSYKSTALIPRTEINAVKSAILERTKKVTSNE